MYLFEFKLFNKRAIFLFLMIIRMKMKMITSFSAQKANAMDKLAQAIPAVKAGLINTLKDFGGAGKGGGGGYGAPQPPSYGAPNQPQSYNAPQQQRPSYNAPSSGYGVTATPNPNILGAIPQAPQAPVAPQQPALLQNVGTNLNFGNQQQQQQQYGNNFNNQQQVFNNAQQAPDSYGSPLGNPIGTGVTAAPPASAPIVFNNNNNNLQATLQETVRQQQGIPNNIVSLTGGNGNSVPITNLQTLQPSPQQTQPLTQLQISTNLPNNNIDTGLTNQALTFVGNNDITTPPRHNPFLENLLLQESRQQQVFKI